MRARVCVCVCAFVCVWVCGRGRVWACVCVWAYVYACMCGCVLIVIGQKWPLHAVLCQTSLLSCSQFDQPCKLKASAISGSSVMPAHWVLSPVLAGGGQQCIVRACVRTRICVCTSACLGACILCLPISAIIGKGFGQILHLYLGKWSVCRGEGKGGSDAGTLFVVMQICLLLTGVLFVCVCM